MIYLDNAATTYPKPWRVIKTAEKALFDYGANPGRSGHKLSQKTSEEVFNSRLRCAEFFGGSPENTAFTLNCTHALNFAIKGAANAVGACHVITTDLEHNSVIRPLFALSRDGKITYSIAKSGDSDGELINSVTRLINKSTRIIVMTAGCNVDGRITPIREIAKIANAKNICLIADCAQGAGVIPLKITDGINIICVPGHKGLYGPMGTGLLISDGKFPLKPIIEGGTGSMSGEITQPDFLPDMIESGTINTPGAIALSSGVGFATGLGFDRIYGHEKRLCDIFIEKTAELKRVIIYRNRKLQYLPVVAFNIDGVESSKAAQIFSDTGFYLRSGLHCNFLAHKKLGTYPLGCIRLAPSVFNSENDILKLVGFIGKRFK